MAEETCSRLFFALWPDLHTRKEIVRIAQGIPVTTGRPVPADNLHLTLVFLGSVSESRKTRLLQGIQPIEFHPVTLHLDRLGWWKRPRVLWLAPTQVPRTLADFVIRLGATARECGIAVEEQEYRPHITLARKVTRQPELPEIRPVTLHSGAYSLVQSVTEQQGARYTVIWNSA